MHTFPKTISIELLLERGKTFKTRDEWMDEFLSSVVHSAPDAWITALDRFGTMSFSKVSKRAIELADYGFPAYPIFIENLARAEKCRRWAYYDNIFFRSGALPEKGDLILQKDLARTLRRLVEVEEKASHLGRHDALMAARDEFYTGDIARELIDYLQDHGGIMTLEDMADFSYLLRTNRTGLSLALVYKKGLVKIKSSANLFESEDHYFAGRPPLLTRLEWQNNGIIKNLTIINVHLKCCGDDSIEFGNEDDEEYRRMKANQFLYDYISDNINSEKVIVTGDWNDAIQEPASTNVFQVFIDDSTRFF